MDIALSWWKPSEGGSRQAIRGNVRALQQAGHTVDLYYAGEISRLEANASAYDAVVLPYIHYPGEWEAYDDTHVHLQLGGYPSENKPQATKNAIEQAETVSALDSSIIAHFQQFWPLDPAGVALIPNPPNRDLFPAHSLDAAGEHALVPKLGSPQKAADELAPVAAASTDVQYRVLYTGTSPSPPDLGENVQYWPGVPLTQMPTQYRDARVVANPSRKDILPNTAFEAWLSGRPYCCRSSAIGHIQSVPADILDTSHWGCSVEWWCEHFVNFIGTGEHYIEHEDDDAESFGSAVQQLMTDDEQWAATVEAADEWLAAWGAWDWQSKGETLTAVIENNGPSTVRS